jgi:hypothetical protein
MSINVWLLMALAALVGVAIGGLTGLLAGFGLLVLAVLAVIAWNIAASRRGNR